MSPPPGPYSLASLAPLTGVPLEEVALAVAAEFGPVRLAEARARLDVLAAPLGDLSGAPADDRANALDRQLAGPEGLAVEDEARPRSLMLDDVLARRSGHPLALTIVHVAVARRAGFELHPVGNERTLLLADRVCDPPLIIEPVPFATRPTVPLHWLCPHIVALRLINAIGRRYLDRGDLANGIHAAELRMLLPMNAASRKRHEVTLRALRARLN